MPIPSISTLLSAMSLSVSIFTLTDFVLDNIEAASSTISIINELGSFAKLILDENIESKNIKTNYYER